MIFQNRVHSGPNLMPSSLLIKPTTVVLSVAMRTILSKQRSWNSFTAPLVSGSLSATCFLAGTKSLLQ